MSDTDEERTEYHHPTRQLLIERVRTPPIVVEGFDLVIPEAPLGEVGVILHTKMIPVEVIAIPFAGVAADKLLYTGPGLYMGHSVKEPTNGAGASFDILDGQDADGSLLVPLTLVVNESTRDWYPLPGITIQGGLFLRRNSGQLTGAVYVGVNDQRKGSPA